MKTNAQNFTQREKSILLFCLKRRMKSLSELDGDFLESTKEWKELNYYPILTTKFKIEDNNGKAFNKSERRIISSCINEELSVKEDDKNIVEELCKILNKVKE